MSLKSKFCYLKNKFRYINVLPLSRTSFAFLQHKRRELRQSIEALRVWFLQVCRYSHLITGNGDEPHNSTDLNNL